MRVTFNVNDNVRVRLTDRGRKLHHTTWLQLRKDIGWGVGTYTPPPETDGWSTWQFWDLMQCFGPYMHNGCTIPFETEIEIVK